MFPTIIGMFLSLLFGGVQPEPEIVPEKPYVVIYPVQDLLQTIPNFTDVPDFDLNAVLNNQRGNNQSPFRQNNQNSPAISKTDPKELINLIQSVVEPEYWISDENSSITYFNGNLIIKAKKSIHEKIK